MTRAERILSLADHLRGADETTTGALAATFGVSLRTLRRDLATLRARGLPITGEAGPGGGLRLEGTRGVTAVHLSVSEVMTLWLAARLSQGASDLPWAGAASSGLSKLLASLPREHARALRALCRRVFVGPPASAAVVGAARAAPPELLRLFEEAFTRRIGLGFRYRDREARATTRRVEPHGLLVQSPVWYVLARDADKDAPRMFRMDRVSRPALLPELHFRPDDAIIRDTLAPGVAWRALLS